MGCISALLRKLRRSYNGPSATRVSQGVRTAGPEERYAPVSICTVVPIAELKRVLGHPRVAACIFILLLDMDDNESPSTTLAPIAARCSHVRVLVLQSERKTINAGLFLREAIRADYEEIVQPWRHLHTLHTETTIAFMGDPLHGTVPTLESRTLYNDWRDAFGYRNHCDIPIGFSKYNQRIGQYLPPRIRQLEIHMTQPLGFSDDRELFPLPAELLKRLALPLRYLRVSVTGWLPERMSHCTNSLPPAHTLCIGPVILSKEIGLAYMTSRPSHLVMRVESSPDGLERVGLLMAVFNQHWEKARTLRTVTVEFVGKPVNWGGSAQKMNRSWMRRAVWMLLHRYFERRRISLRVTCHNMSP